MSGRKAVDLAQFTHWVPVEIRYSDLDTQGHVNNAVYFTYFEHARVRFLYALRERIIEEQRRERERQHAAEAQEMPADLPFVVATAACAYRRPITGLEPVVVGVRCAASSRASIDLEYAICDRPQGRLYATGNTTIVSVDPDSGRPRALPTWALRAIERRSGKGETSSDGG